MDPSRNSLRGRREGSGFRNGAQRMARSRATSERAERWIGLAGAVLLAGWLQAQAVEGEVIQWGCLDLITNTVDMTLPPALTNVISVAAGHLHNLALRSDGTVISWGSITNPPDGLEGVIAIAAGDNHSLALKSDGRVVAWGRTTVPAGLDNVVAIAAAGHSMALRADGTVVEWGRIEERAPAGTFVAIAAGGTVFGSSSLAFGVGLQDNGKVVAWGSDRLGSPTVVPFGLSNVVAIAAGLADTMALKSDGTVVAWGWNFSGQTSVPPDLRDVVAIEAGRSRCLAVKSDGTVVAWGEPPGVRDGLDNIVAVSTGTCTLAIRASLKISSVTVVAGQPLLHFRTFSGRQYSADHSTEIPPSEWPPVPGAIEGYGRMAELRDTAATGDTTRYYRLREWPR